MDCYINLRRTANTKTTTDTHTREIKQPKHNTKDGYQTARKQKMKGRKKTYKTKPKTIKKMAIGPYISIITLNVNGLMLQPKDIKWLNGYKSKSHIYAVYKRPTSDLGTHTH